MKKLFALLMCAALVFSAALAEITEITYESRGVQVPATLTTPDGAESYPIVIMAHGHGGNRDEGAGYIAIADALAMQGIASIRMDFPGCGKSTEPFTMNTMSNMKADVLSAIDYAKAALPVTTVGIFGYSMGGRIVVELIREGFIPDAAAVLAPAVDTGIDGILGSMTEEALAAFEAEGHYAYTTRYGQNLDVSKEWYEDLKKYTYPDLVDSAAAAYAGRPMLVIYADDDSVVNPAGSQYVADTFGADLVKANGCDHSYGFYSEDMAVRNAVVYGVSSFFTFNLK